MLDLLSKTSFSGPVPTHVTKLKHKLCLNNYNLYETELIQISIPSKFQFFSTLI